MKISIITVSFNSEKTIRDTMESIHNQTYNNIEHIVIDGKSTDSTLGIVSQYPVSKIISEYDNGIYDAMNKGIKEATGDFIGFLNSDDVYNDFGCIESIALKLKENLSIDMIFGNILIVSHKNISKILRFNNPGPHKINSLLKGWLPPHPTLYVRSSVLRDVNGFNTKYEIQADFELMLRLFEVKKYKSCYLDKILVRQRFGGASTKISNILKGNLEASDACKINGFHGGLFFILRKVFSRIPQFFNRPKFFS